MRTQSLRLVLLAILNSIVQFLGVLLWRWPIGNVFLLFWVENVIITIMSIARVAAVPRGGGGELAGKLIASSVLAIFAVVHGAFTVALALATGLNLGAAFFAVPVVVLILRYAVEALGWFGPRAPRPSSIDDGYRFALRRIVTLHIAIMASWFVLVFGIIRLVQDGGAASPLGASLPLVALAILLLAKTVSEISSLRGQAAVQPAPSP
jgi:hypothetical protein